MPAAVDSGPEKSHSQCAYLSSQVVEVDVRDVHNED